MVSVWSRPRDACGQVLFPRKATPGRNRHAEPSQHTQLWDGLQLACCHMRGKDSVARAIWCFVV
eukprot:7379120-Prymnesium_polylepis.1